MGRFCPLVGLHRKGSAQQQQQAWLVHSLPALGLNEDGDGDDYNKNHNEDDHNADNPHKSLFLLASLYILLLLQKQGFLNVVTDHIAASSLTQAVIRG